ncbi:hypothetical protein QR680_002126 [Steinernema hermaphroditum]|uniref:Uncharacterized protein n=1 Tax=Steinernema hermaphroditum TaxID=289476 RepID=A0AA39H1D6_9BILA|nr:hypothetical protein QR680_002126 [Steinernema hermaphroditum]
MSPSACGYCHYVIESDDTSRHLLVGPPVGLTGRKCRCLDSSGAQRVSVRMVGSQGFRRQDIVFGLSCRAINELYPWWGIPQGIAELEREDCRYSRMFDPIVDTSGNYSCNSREYLAGISRISDTRVQLECCRMRTRDETNCIEKIFGKPFGNDPRTEIEYQGKLINAIRTENHSFKVRFCDLAPRAVGLIFEDVPPTTTTRSTTPRPTPAVTTPSLQEIVPEDVEPLLSDRSNSAAEGLLDSDTGATPARRVIKVSRPSSLVASDSGSGIWSTAQPTTITQIEVTSSSTTSEQPDEIAERKEEEPTLPKDSLPQDNSLTEAQKIAQKIIARVKSGEGIEGEKMAAQLVKEIESQNDPKTADELFKQSIATLNEYVDDKDLDGEPAVDVIDADSTVDLNLQTSQLHIQESPQFVLLKPLEQRRAPQKSTTDSKDPNKHSVDELLEEAPFDQFPTAPQRKETVIPRKFPSRPLRTVKTTTPRTYTTRQYHPRNSDKSPYVDEETSNSPFDYENLDRVRVTPSPRRPLPRQEEDEEEPTRRPSRPKAPVAVPQFAILSPFDVDFSRDIRRAPQKYRSAQNAASSQSLTQDMIFPSFDDENGIDSTKEYMEVDLPRLLKDGTKNHLPADGQPMKMPGLIVYDTLNPKNVPTFNKKKTHPPSIPPRSYTTGPPAAPSPPGVSMETLVSIRHIKPSTTLPTPKSTLTTSTSTTTSAPSTAVTEETTQTEYENGIGESEQQDAHVEYDLSAESTPPTYDPSKFYHTLPPKRQKHKENILTFCTKEVAIRDSNNLVIACGGEHDVWQPPRCPVGTDCFYATDSTYRICCAVSSG